MREISGRFVVESERNLLCPISGSSKILYSNGRVDVMLECLRVAPQVNKLKRTKENSKGENLKTNQSEKAEKIIFSGETVVKHSTYFVV